jgi:uncharacterized protein YqgV (UPF0045/DUF77 family)
MEKTPMIQTTVAIYPLQQTDYEAVHRAISSLRESDVTVEVRAMHTEITGNSTAIFQALQQAYEAAAELGPTVMTVTLSNACPTSPASTR